MENINKDLIGISDVIRLIQEENNIIFKNIIKKFLNEIDASKLFLEYFEVSHITLHNVLGDDYPCVKIKTIIEEIYKKKVLIIQLLKN